MAHFAEIESGIVQRVIVVANDDCTGGEFPGSEASGQAFIADLGIAGEWKQTSYNNNFRGGFAGIGYTFDGANFIAPKPYPSWILDGVKWTAPVAMPDDGAVYSWDEETLAWVEMGAL